MSLSESSSILPTDNVARRLRRAQVRLTLDYGNPPQWIYVDEIAIDPYYTETGGFADVYKGRYMGRSVAVKRARVDMTYGEEEKKALREVSNYPVTSMT